MKTYKTTKRLFADYGAGGKGYDDDAEVKSLCKVISVEEFSSIGPALNNVIGTEVAAGWVALNLLDFKILSERLKRIQVGALYECVKNT